MRHARHASEAPGAASAADGAAVVAVEVAVEVAVAAAVSALADENGVMARHGVPGIRTAL